MSSNRWITCAAILGGLGVAFGTFGAHLLPGFLEKADYTSDQAAGAIASFQTGVRYQMFHVPVLMLIGVLLSQGRRRAFQIAALQIAGWAFLLGVLLFSGFLYAYILTHQAWPWMVHVVPVGGTLLIVGWLALAGAFCCSACDEKE